MLVISFLEQLEQTEGVLARKLDPAEAQISKEEHLHLDEKTFRWMQNEDAMERKSWQKVSDRLVQIRF